MKFSSAAALALLSAAEIVNAAPAAAPVSEGMHQVLGAGHMQAKYIAKLKKRSTYPLGVTGAREGDSGAYRVYRQDIHTFQTAAGGLVANLYILALNQMQGESAGNWKSYWEIAGVHGRPFHAFGEEPNSPANPNTGYCTHGSTLFPTWHRPYLAYYEQVVWNNAAQFVDKVTDSSRKQQWTDALMQLRIPYFDWASNSQMPSLFTSESYQVILPTGQQTSMRNPLYANYFKNGYYNNQANFGDAPFYSWSSTLRWPTSTASNAVSQNGAVNQQLAQNAGSLKSRVYQLLTSGTYKNWCTFSNHACTKGDSLEGIHDTIHGLVGNGGHMAYIDYSSFDPIFWSHHANIDRLFAIYQAVNPHVWVTPYVNPGGTYGIQPGTNENSGTPLAPWHGLNGHYWTSDSVRDTSTFGYGYYETPKWRFSLNSPSYLSYVKSSINKLYGTTNAAIAQASKLKKRSIIPDPANKTAVCLDESVQDHSYYDWSVLIEADKRALNTSYFCHIFLREPVENPSSWSSQDGLVGDFYVMTPKSGNMVAPGVNPDDMRTTVYGTIPLTQALITYFNGTQESDQSSESLASLMPEKVVNFLRKNLRYRVTTATDSACEIEKVPGLKLTVVASKVDLPSDNLEGDGVPEWGPWVEYPVVEHIHNGGSGPGSKL